MIKELSGIISTSAIFGFVMGIIVGGTIVKRESIKELNAVGIEKIDKYKNSTNTVYQIIWLEKDKK